VGGIPLEPFAPRAHVSYPTGFDNSKDENTMTKSPQPTSIDRATARRIAAALARQRRALLERLERFVHLESPSTDKGALDRFSRLLTAECRSAGAKVERFPQKHAGDHILARFPAPGRGRPILILGHYDTVYPLGALDRNPFRIRAGRIAGPGTLDMKAGLAMALAAVESLAGAGVPPAGPVHCLFTSDEEIGSRHSRKLIERFARGARAVLVLEPAAGLGGKLKTARKGTGEIELVVHGKSAHAGLNPEEGVNAIHELAAQVDRIRAFNNPAKGATVSAGVVEGGTRTNVIPELARAVFDLRVTRLEDAAPIERRFAALRPVLRGAKLEIHGGFNRPPMERTPAVAALFRHCKSLGDLLGLHLEETAVGGASDGNFTAALGIPTLDGLGGVGAGAHSPTEFVFLRSLTERAALLALLLATIPETLARP
jgi:glutamate carboxypeptidase